MVERGRLVVDGAVGSAGRRQDDAGRLLADAVDAPFDDALARRERRRPTCGRPSLGRRDWIDARRPLQRPVHRRDPPLQQGASRTRCCRTSRTARRRSSAPRPRTPTSRSTRRCCRGCACSAWSRSTDEEVGDDRGPRADGRAGLRPAGHARRRCSRALVGHQRRGRARGAERPRGRGWSMLRPPSSSRGWTSRSSRPPPSSASSPTTGPATATTARSARSSRAARQRPRRRALLAGDDGRGRGGPEVHRAAAHHQRERGRRERRPACAPGRGGGGRRRSTGSGCRRRSTRWRRRRSTSRTAPKSNRSGQAYWAAVADVQRLGSQPVPGHLLNALRTGR